jgi:UDP-N-acetylmuramoyl-L-alanyl-D-glutamate--2,6-diaminopimelate ligase
MRPRRKSGWTGIAHDSRQVKKGYLFAALPSASGKQTDTLGYIRQAVKRGAAGVLAEAKVLKAAQLPPAVAGIASKALRRDYAAACADHYGWPAKKLRLTGITGTNGKTTTSFLLRGLLQQKGWSSVLVGTVEYRVGQKRLDAPNTTPSALELQSLFAQGVKAGCKAAVMEVSSHALDQGRVAGLEFDVAAFSNLTRDHLDYHKTMARYGAAKARLFGQLKPSGVAVLNADDPASKRMAAARTRGAKLLTYSAAGKRAELRAEKLVFEMDGTRFNLCFDGRRLALRLPLPGRFNVANALAAAGCALGQGLSLTQVAKGLGLPHLPPGRFELVRLGQPFNVVVDYAHTPDALERLMQAAREVTPGRLITVFGCGGDRDRGKRPLMGALAAAQSELAVLTSDNPRTESAEGILDEVFAGIPAAALGHCLRVVDRRQAIRWALLLAQPGDSVLIAGKGHEDYQIVGGVKQPFDDREEARAGLKRLGFSSAGSEQARFAGGH